MKQVISWWWIQGIWYVTDGTRVVTEMNGCT